MKKILIFILILFFVSKKNTANKIQEITLQQCINAVLKNNNNIKILKDSIKINQEKISDSKRNYYPNILLLLNKNEYEESNYIENKAGIEFSQLLWDGGKLKSILKQKKADVISVSAELFKFKNQLQKDAIFKFFELKKKINSLNIQLKKIKNIEYLKNNAKIKFNKNIISQYEMDEIIEKYEQTSLDVEVAKNECTIAEYELKKIMNLDIDKNISISEISYPEPDFIDTFTVCFNLKNDIQKAIETSPTIKNINAAIEYYKQSLILAKANYLPEFNLVGNYNIFDKKNLYGNKNEYFIGIKMKLFLLGNSLNAAIQKNFEENQHIKNYSLTLNLLDKTSDMLSSPLDTRNSVVDVNSLSVQKKEAKQQLAKAKENLLIEIKNIKLKLKKNFINLKELFFKFNILGKKIILQKNKIKKAKRKNKLGVINPIEIFEVYLDLYKLEEEKSAIWLDYIFSKLSYEFIIGKINFEEEKIEN